MKTYHIELEHTVFVVMEVQADSEKEAIELAHLHSAPQEMISSIEFEADEPSMVVEVYHGGTCDGGLVTQCEEE
tara:strand:- start:9161 stop:9382 length:222 start_codon:yes stop_codon:yes gene_type:complete